jgi:hypothetical protein
MPKKRAKGCLHYAPRAGAVALLLLYGGNAATVPRG